MTSARADRHYTQHSIQFGSNILVFSQPDVSQTY